MNCKHRASTAINRPHCLNVDACASKRPHRHCMDCARQARIAPAEWTQKEIDALYRLRAQGVGYTEISESLPGRSMLAVKKRCTLLSIPMGVRRTPVRKAHDGPPTPLPEISAHPEKVHERAVQVAAAQGSAALLRAYARYYERHVMGKAA